MSLGRFALSLGLLTLAMNAHARPTLDGERMLRLDRWEVLVFTDPWANGIERGKAIGVFQGTPDEIFRVASEYAKYQDFLPRVRQSTVSAHEGSQAIVEITAELPWPAGRAQVTARYTQEKLSGEIYRIKFAMVRGEMKQYLGQVYIEPWAPGRTAVTYELVA